MAQIPDFQAVLRQIAERVLCRDRGIPVSRLDSELERLRAMSLYVTVPTNDELDAMDDRDQPEMSLDEDFVARRAEQRIEEIWELAKSDPLRAEARAGAFRRWLAMLWAIPMG